MPTETEIPDIKITLEDIIVEDCKFRVFEGILILQTLSDSGISMTLSSMEYSIFTG